MTLSYFSLDYPIPKLFGEFRPCARVLWRDFPSRAHGIWEFEELLKSKGCQFGFHNGALAGGWRRQGSHIPQFGAPKEELICG
jgi:hypothetical protein